jgi:hemolysin activation/secretion protein
VQSLPDAGSLQYGAPTELPARLPVPGRPTPDEAVNDVPASTGPQVTVRRFVLDARAELDEAVMQAAIAPYLNRPVSYEELQAAAQAVAVAYRQAGWVVSAVLPEQDISDGEVRITVTNALFGGVTMRGGEAVGLRIQNIESYITEQQTPLQPLRTDGLERALLLIDDLPGLSATGVLRAGQYAGETDLLVQLEPTARQSGELSLDNTGARSTGYQRALANWNKSGLLTWGDQFSANLVHTFTQYQSDGSDYQRVNYSLPLGYEGWRLALGGSVFSYRLVSSEFSGLGFYGESDAWDLELTYPLLRNQSKNLYLMARAEQKHVDNQGANITVSRYRSEEQSWGLRGNLFDDLGAGASSAASLIVGSGFLDLRDSPTESTDATTTATNGTFTRLRYSLSRDQGLGRGFSAFAAVNGQTADKNLDSSAKFYLGGSNGVRAYPSSEGSGYQGFVLNLEARWKPTADWQLAALYDYGYVTVNHDNSYSGASTLNEYALKGYGLSAAWRGERKQTLALTWARRIGDNANATTAGNDQDGTYYRERFWLTASLAF